MRTERQGTATELPHFDLEHATTNASANPDPDLGQNVTDCPGSLEVIPREGPVGIPERVRSMRPRLPCVDAQHEVWREARARQWGERGRQPQRQIDGLIEAVDDRPIE